jgi:hypothetical protein
VNSDQEQDDDEEDEDEYLDEDAKMYKQLKGLMKFPPIKKGQMGRRNLQDLMRDRNDSRNEPNQILFETFNVKPTKKFQIKKSPQTQVKRPPKPLKRPPLFPVAAKKNAAPAPISEATENYIKAPVFMRLHERTTNAFTNYMTSSVSK